MSSSGGGIVAAVRGSVEPRRMATFCEGVLSGSGCSGPPRSSRDDRTPSRSSPPPLRPHSPCPRPRGPGPSRPPSPGQSAGTQGPIAAEPVAARLLDHREHAIAASWPRAAGDGHEAAPGGLRPRLRPADEAGRLGVGHERCPRLQVLKPRRPKDQPLGLEHRPLAHRFRLSTAATTEAADGRTLKPSSSSRAWITPPLEITKMAG